MASTAEPASVRFAEFVLDPGDERLLGPAGPIRIGNKAFQVLWTLVGTHGRLLTKEELFETVWDGTVVSESALTSVIKELRRALGDDSRDPRFIEAVYGRGYRFLAPVEDLPRTAAPAGAKSPPPVPVEPGRAAGPREFDRRWWLAALAIVLVAILGVGAWRLQGDGAVVGAHIRIEPLRAAEGDSTARLVSQNLASDLSRIAVANDSTISFSDARDQTNTRADYILAGEAQSANGTVSTAVRLTDGTRRILWSRDFSASSAELGALRQQMSARIGQVLVCAFGARSRRPKDIDLATLRLFLTGCENMDVDIPAAREAFAEVVERAPHFAQARGIYAASLVANNDVNFPPQEQMEANMRKALAHARRALEEDPHVGTAYLLLAGAASREGIASYPEVDAILRRGIAADPLASELHLARCIWLRSLGFWRESQAECERAVALESISPGNLGYLAETYALDGRMPEALELLDRAHQWWPGDPFTGWIRFEIAAIQGDARKALEVLDNPDGDLGFRPSYSDQWRIFLHARLEPATTGEAAGAIAKRATDAPPWAKVYAVRQLVTLDRFDEAYQVAMAVQPAEARMFSPYWLSSTMTRFHADARFPRLAKRHGLTRAWARLKKLPDICSEPGLAWRCPATPEGWRNF